MSSSSLPFISETSNCCQFYLVYFSSQILLFSSLDVWFQSFCFCICATNLFNILNLSSTFLNIWNAVIKTVLMSLYTIYLICVIFKSVSIDWFFFYFHQVSLWMCFLYACPILSDWVIDVSFILLGTRQIQVYLWSAVALFWMQLSHTTWTIIWSFEACL